MSAGPLSEYAGISGVADSGGDKLTEEFNIYYSVRPHYTLQQKAGACSSS
jgi:hypothetical protein